MANFTDYAASVEAMSGGTNKVIFDDAGLPSIMVAFPKLKYSDVFAGDLAIDETLPAFIVKGVEKDIIWVSKYQNIVIENRAYSLPNKNPKTSIDFNTSVNACRQKGYGWALMPNSVWAAVALWSKKNETIPHGNNNYGAESNCPHEKGISAAKETSGLFRTSKTKTGSGANTWYHNYDYSGLSDFGSNIEEWVTGLRLCFGEIQVIADDMNPSVDFSSDSVDWKAILQDGTFVTPGTNNTLKYNRFSNIAIDTVVTSTLSRTALFGKTSASENVAHVPSLLYAFGLFPVDSNISDELSIALSNTECIARRGNSYLSAKSGGTFRLSLAVNRLTTSGKIGFRSTYFQ